MLISLTDSTFRDAIKDGICILDFYADWCQPCKPISKSLEELSLEFPDVGFYKIDVEKCPSAAANLGVTGLPTIYILRNGEYKSGIYVSRNKKELRREILTVVEG